MKFVREESRPISGDTGLFDIKAMAEANEFAAAAQPGKMYPLDTSQAYVQHLLSYVDVASLKPLKIVVDAGNGGAGRVVDLLEPYLPFEFIKLHHEADGNFPNGVPNPLLPENRVAAIAAVREHGADLGRHPQDSRGPAAIAAAGRRGADFVGRLGVHLGRHP